MSLKKIMIASTAVCLLLGAGCEDVTMLTVPSETDIDATGTTDPTPSASPSPTAAETPSAAPSPSSSDNELDIDTGVYNANGLEDK
jgi:hypothetical protein